VPEVCFKDRLKQHFQPLLNGAIPDRGNPQRSFSAIAFPDVAAPHGSRLILPTPEFCRPSGNHREVNVKDIDPVNARRLTALITSDLLPGLRQRRQVLTQLLFTPNLTAHLKLTDCCI